MINEFILQLSISCALFFYLLDYALGMPGGEKWNEKAILSFWVLWLCEMILTKNELTEYWVSQKPTKPKKSSFDYLATYNNYKKLIYENTFEYFGAEKVLGLCPICTHFWWTLLIFILFVHTGLLTFITYFLFSHLLIRILNRFV